MSSSNTYVLSVRVPKYMKRSCVVHYLIDQDHLGIRLRVSSMFIDRSLMIFVIIDQGNEESVSNIELLHCSSFDCT